MVVLFSDLLEACGDDDGARDMIIAHELAHIRCGHLKWIWFTLPGHFVPFLGGALSRAREYTCDRFGLAGARSTGSALRGLAILSAGPAFASRVNLTAFVDQREDLNTGFMTLGEWFGSHPPLAKRIAALDASVAEHAYDPSRGRAMALAILVLLFVGGAAGTVAVATVGVAMLGTLVDPALLEPQSGIFDDDDASFTARSAPAVDPAQARATVDGDFQTLTAFIAARWDMAAPPESMTAVRVRWQSEMSDAFPTDPFDGLEYGYDPLDGGFRLWSSGPDGEPLTDDDIIVTHPRG
jgi:hypothetical protein